MRTKLPFVLLFAASILLGGCESKPTPPPASPGQLWVKVYVVRDTDDDYHSSNKPGYEWDNYHITSLMDQAIASNVITGTNMWVQWDRQIHTLYMTSGQSSKVFLSYVQWAQSLGVGNDIWRDYYNHNTVSIFFVPGIVDSSSPGRYMDTFTLDPAFNQESAFWNDMYPVPVPTIYITDCWVAPWIPPGGIQGALSSGKISKSLQRQKLIVERALGRFLLRLESSSSFDGQEYWTGSPTDTYMAWWNQRGRKPVAQNHALNKLSTGPFVP